MTDMDLLENYRQDEKPMWLGELYQRYSHLVFGVCLKYLKNEEDARDATIAIFEKLIYDLRRREVATFQHWLYAVSKNHCLMILRSRSRQATQMGDFEYQLTTSLESEMESMQLAHLREGDLLQLEAAIESLNGEQQQCVKMFYLEEKSYKEITELTGFPIGKVKSYIQNGRRNLKLLLQNAK
jgi:RNA polymerase sigma factor (sigma-70 family)